MKEREIITIPKTCNIFDILSFLYVEFRLHSLRILLQRIKKTKENFPEKKNRRRPQTFNYLIFHPSRLRYNFKNITAIL